MIRAIYKEVYNQDIVSIDDAKANAAVELTLPISPVQDLHGYDNPWPGGGGKNLFDAEHPSVTYSGGVTYVYNADGSITLSGTANSNASLFFFTLPNEIPSGTVISWSLNNATTNSEVGVRVVRRESGSIANWGTAVYADDVNKTATVTPTGYNANEINVFVKTNHEAVPEITLKIQLELGNKVTDWTPYANICPISGHTECNVTRTGKNLHNKSTDTNGYYISASGVITSSGYYAYSDLIPVEEGKEYTFSGVNGRNASYTKRWHGYDANGTWVKQIASKSATAYSAYSMTETIDTGIKYVRISYLTEDTNVKVSRSNEYEITFPDAAGTVYGGALTVNEDGTGTLVCDKAVFTIPELASSDIMTSALARSTGKYALISTTGLKVIPTSETESIFEAVKCVSYTRRGQAWEGCLSSSAISHMVFVPSDATLAEINSALQGTKIVATLATPITYNLTELEVVETLKGVNNVWASTGEISYLKYQVDDSAYWDAIKAGNRTHMRMSFTGQNVVLEDDDIYLNTGVNVHDILNGDTDLVFGKAVSKQVTTAILNKKDIVRTIDTPKSVMTFDAVEAPMDITTEIKPVQDLNGYDNPWPGGGGKNLLPNAATMDGWTRGTLVSVSDGIATLQGASSNWNSRLTTKVFPSALYDGVTNYVYSIEYKSNDDCNIVPVIGCQAEGSSSRTKSKTLNTITIPSTNGEWQRITIFSRTISISDLTSGSGGTDYGRLDIYNRSTDIEIQIRHEQLEVGSSVTDWEPYANICPITGHTEANITKVGKNLFNRTTGKSSGGGITYTYNDDGTVSTTGTATSNTSNNLGTFTAKAGITYVLNGTPTNAESGIYVRFHGPGESEYTFSYSASSTNDYKVEFTFDTDTTGYVDIRVGNGKNVSGFTFKPMIRIASVMDNTFVPFIETNLYDKLTDTTGYYISASGVITQSASFSYSALIPVEEGKEYIFSGVNSYTSANTKRLHGYNADGTWVKQIKSIYAPAEDSFSITATIESGIKYVRLSFRTADTKILFCGTIVKNIQFPSEAGTVYGGTLTINEDGTGTLVVDKGYTTVNDNEWEYDSSYTRFKTVISGIKTGVPIRTLPFICSAFISIDDGRDVSSVPNNAIYGGGTNPNIYIKNSIYTDAAQFKTAYSDVQIVYPLATPVTYNFTAQQIKSLLGENNIWTDTGDVESVTYYEHYNKLNNLKWTGEFTLEFGVEMGDPLETNWVTIGTFSGERPNNITTANIIDFTAYDRMMKFDVLADEFVKSLTYPLTVQDIYDGLCSYVGIQNVVGDELANIMSRSFASAPVEMKGYTCRDILEWIAEACGCYAKINADGNVKMVWFVDNTSHAVTGTEEFSIESGDINDGMIWNEADQYTWDSFDELTWNDVCGYQETYKIDQICIKQLNNSFEVNYPYNYGGNIYTIVENPFLSISSYADMMNYVAPLFNRMDNFGGYFPAYIDCVGDWCVEAGDIITVDIDGKTLSYPIFVKQFIWNGASNDSYETTGNKNRAVYTSDISKQQVIASNKIEMYVDEALENVDQNYYKIRSGIAIDQDGVTVSGSKYVKIESGGAFSLNSENFVIDSENKVVNISTGTFNVTSGNFSLDSTNQILKAGEWRLDGNGIYYNHEDGFHPLYLRIGYSGNPVGLGFTAGWPNMAEFVTATLGQGGYRYNHGYMVTGSKSNFYVDILTSTEISTKDIDYTDLHQQSSRNIKHGIEAIPSMGETLDRLQPVTFIYDDDELERRRPGLIYENTIDVLPEICSGQENTKSINYLDLVPMLLKEIQELRLRVKTLEEREVN